MQLTTESIEKRPHKLCLHHNISSIIYDNRGIWTYIDIYLYVLKEKDHVHHFWPSFFAYCFNNSVTHKNDYLKPFPTNCSVWFCFILFNFFVTHVLEPSVKKLCKSVYKIKRNDLNTSSNDFGFEYTLRNLSII